MPNASQQQLINALNTAKPATTTLLSPYCMMYRTIKHLCSISKVYPTLAAGVTVTAGNAAAWTLGDFVEVVPASTITSDFAIHNIGVEGISANGVYEIVLYSGDSDTECGRVRFTKNAAQDGTMEVPFQTTLIDANSKIRAKVASSTGNLDTVDISIRYHVCD